jgi:hypothetical protein
MLSLTRFAGLQVGKQNALLKLFCTVCQTITLEKILTLFQTRIIIFSLSVFNPFLPIFPENIVEKKIIQVQNILNRLKGQIWHVKRYNQSILMENKKEFIEGNIEDCLLSNWPAPGAKKKPAAM